MILQRIVFPLPRQAEAAGLYYRSTGELQIQNRYSAYIPAGETMELCTYFNAFSARRWKAFTSIKNVFLFTELSGKGTIRLMFADQRKAVCIQEQICSMEKKTAFLFPVELTDRPGVYYLEAEAMEGAALVVHNAGFETKEPPLLSVRIALVTCTFHREEQLYQNINQIKTEILENRTSALREFLNVFVIDNGKSLPNAKFFSPQIRLFSNANTGGSGGFARGMAEALRERERHGYTHVLLMDDDVTFDTECLERTYALLCFLRKHYRAAAVGGAMLRSDAPCLLEEAGAKWPGRLKRLGHGLDLAEIPALFQYDAIGNAEYQAWWYCCIPMSVIGQDQLPLPFFIHGDDIEYGLRNYKYVLQLNGICVWHDTFENKRPSYLEYYDVRNQLIVNAIHDGRILLTRQLLDIFKRSVGLIFRMRYKDVELVVRGIEDFLKVPKWQILLSTAVILVLVYCAFTLFLKVKLPMGLLFK